jgi:hypothetical protein
VDIFSKRLLVMPWPRKCHWSMFIVVRPILACLKHRGRLSPINFVNRDGFTEARSSTSSSQSSPKAATSSSKTLRRILVDDGDDDGAGGGGCNGGGGVRSGRKPPKVIIEADEEDGEEDGDGCGVGSNNADPDFENFACILYLDSLPGHHQDSHIVQRYDQIVR